MNLLQQIQMLKNNPSGIGQILYQNGKINQQQFGEIQKMQSPEQITNYLLNNNIMNNQQFNQLKNQAMQYMNQIK